jgi:hypothetical protein
MVNSVDATASNNPSLNVLEKLENSQYNKTNMEQMYSFINMIEKKKFQYTLLVTPLLFDERKTSKRNKKVISNNKFILFNSWYTKIKQISWPVTRMMWDLIKNKHELADFVFVFDYVEKLGKKLAQRISSSSSTSSADESVSKKKKKTTTNTNTNIAELKQNSDMKNQLYIEFYKVLNETFTNDVAPVQSNIYDTTLSRDFLTKSMRTFKTIALKMPVSNSVHATPAAVAEKKRKISCNINNGASKRAFSSIKNRRNTTVCTNNTMVSDTTQDSNMSE